MSTEQSGQVQYTAKPVAAGILNIIAGAGVMLGILSLGMAMLFFMPFSRGGVTINFPFIAAVLSLPAITLSVLSILGGIYAMRRKTWGLALAGAIAAVIISNIIGVISIVLLAVSKNEFVQ